MGRYLKHMPTGEVYGFNPTLAERGDMIEIDALPGAEAEVIVEAPVSKTKPRKTSPVVDALNETPDGFSAQP